MERGGGPFPGSLSLSETGDSHGENEWSGDYGADGVGGLCGEGTGTLARGEEGVVGERHARIRDWGNVTA